MKKIFIPFIIIAGIFSSSSCTKDFDGMSENPYALVTAPAEEYVHPAVFKTQSCLIDLYRGTISLLVQHAVSTNSEIASRVVDNYHIADVTAAGPWQKLYLQLGNAEAMLNQALKDEDQEMIAIAYILKSFIILNITDIYGNVPYFEAAQMPLHEEITSYTTKYDDQKDIYRSMVIMLEEANEILGATEKYGFSAICDKVFDGDFAQWRRFGNSIYARVLMRIGMKVIEEDGGIFELGDDKWEAISVKSKLGELYSCFMNAGGDYPQMRSIDDRPKVPFSTLNETEHTPFFSTTSGNWNVVAVCDVLTRRMLDYTTKVDSQNITYYEYRASSDGGHIEDPRYDCWWRKANGMPTQLFNDQRKTFLDAPEHKSNAGNSKIGRMVRGKNANGEPEPSIITGKVYDLQNADFYPLMQYSELPFIYAEAGARGWIPSISGLGAYLGLFKQGITNSILEWNPYVTADDPDVIAYVNYCAATEKYSGETFNSDNALEAILTQKWLSQFFIGIEPWCDYRRTGYPILKTNGPAADNDCILPTRFRYPTDELYRNPVYYPEAVNGWLGGTDNIQTDVWWADTQESKEIRLLGRQ